MHVSPLRNCKLRLSDEESSKEKMPEKIDVADSGGQVVIDSTEALESVVTKISTPTSPYTNTSHGKNLLNDSDKNKLTNTENENSPTSLSKSPQTLKPKQRSLTLLRREKEINKSGFYEEYCFSECQDETEEKRVETDDQNSPQLNEESVITISPNKFLNPKELSISIDKTETDLWVSSESENKKPTNLHENDDFEIDVCELSLEKDNELLNPESVLSNKSAQHSVIVCSENEENNVEIEAHDTNSKEKENIKNRNAVVVLKDILENGRHQVTDTFVKKTEEVHLKTMTPKKRYNLSIVEKVIEKDGEVKEVETREDLEKEDFEIKDEAGKTGEKTQDVPERKEADVSGRKSEIRVSESEESGTKNAAEFENVEDNLDVSFVDWNEQLDWSCSLEEENQERASYLKNERKKSISDPIDNIASLTENDQKRELFVKNQQIENSPLENSTADKFEQKIIEVEVIKPEENVIIENKIEKSPEKKMFERENEKCLSPKISPRKVPESSIKTPEKSPLKVSETSGESPEILTKTPESSPTKTSESLIKTTSLGKSETEKQTFLQEKSIKISADELENPRSNASCNSQDTVIYEPQLQSPQATSSQNSPLKRSTVMISPRKLENTLNEKLDSDIEISDLPKEKSTKTSVISPKSISEQKKSDLETLKASSDISTEESPGSLNLRFEYEFENGTPDIVSHSIKNIDEIKSEVVFNVELSDSMVKVFKEEMSPGYLKLESELENKNLAFLVELHKQEQSPGNLSLRSEIKNANESENEMQNVSLAAIQNSIKVDSDIEIKDEPLNSLTQFPKIKSPAKLNVQSENRNTSESENQLPNMSSASRKSIEKEDSEIEIEDEFLGSSSESPKKENLVKLSLQSESRSMSESENKTLDVTSNSRKNTENEVSDSEIEDEFSKLQQEVLKEKSSQKLSKKVKAKSVSPAKRMSNGSVERNFTDIESGYLDENESTDEEIEALETFEKIKALQLKETEALKLKKKLSALILKNETEVLKLKEELDTQKSKDVLELVNSKETKSMKVKDRCREEIELKGKDESIVKLVDFETRISFTSGNRGPSIVTGSPGKQTDEKEEELESLFKDITEEEFNSQRRQIPSNLERESEDDLVLLDEEDAEEHVESLQSSKKTFNDSSILILDHDRLKVQKEKCGEPHSQPRSPVKRLSVESMDQIRHSPKKNENLISETLRNSPDQKPEKSSLKKFRKSPATSDSSIDEKKSETSPAMNQSSEKQRSSESAENTTISDEGKKTTGPVVRKIEILKTGIPFKKLKGDEGKVEKEVKGKVTELEEEIKENGKTEWKNPLDQSREKSKINMKRLPLQSNLDLPMKPKPEIVKILNKESIKREKTWKDALPTFLRNSTSSEDEDTDSSIDTDVAMEYNLPGRKVPRLNDVTGDECRSSEDEDLYSDSEDQGSLVDFIVSDDANLETNETPVSDSEVNSSDNQENVELQKFMKKIKQSVLPMQKMESKEESSKTKKKKEKTKKKDEKEPEIADIVEQREDENSQNKKKKKKKRNKQEKSEVSIEIIEIEEDDLLIKKKKKKKNKKESKEEPEVSEEVEESEENNLLSKKKKKKKKGNRKVEERVEENEIEREIQIEIKPKKKKKKDKVLSEESEEKIELQVPEERKQKKNIVIFEMPEEKVELKVPEKRKKKKNKVLSEMSEEKIELEVPEKRKKKKNKVFVEVSEEKVELEVPEKRKKKKHKNKAKEDEEFYKEEKKKNKEETLNEEIPQVEEEQVKPKRKKNKDKKKKNLEVKECSPVDLKDERKKTKEEGRPTKIPQFNLQALSEQPDKKKKKRKMEQNDVEVSEFDLQIPEPKKKYRKITHDVLLEIRNQERNIKEQEIKIRDQERRIKNQEIKIKYQEMDIRDREKEINDQEKEIGKKKKQESKQKMMSENVNKKSIKRMSEEVIEDFSDLPQERKKQKLSNVGFMQDNKPKSKENIGKAMKKLPDFPEKIIKSLSNLPKQNVPSLSMIDTEIGEFPYLVDEESSKISSSGSTSKFMTSGSARKARMIQDIRENVLKRRLDGVSAFISHRVQRPKKKHLAHPENLTKSTIRLGKSNRFTKDAKKVNM